MKKLFLFFAFSMAALCQATWTPPVQPTTGNPGKLVVTDITTGAPPITCTLTGNAVPATYINIVCTGQQPFTINLSAGQAITINLNMVNPGTAFPTTNGTAINSVGFILTAVQGGGIQVQAAWHGNSMVTQGSF